MTKQLHYGTTAKVFHWLIVALLCVQYPLGWFMPEIHRGAKPSDALMFHVSLGITILALIVLRLLWRITHPVAPERSLPAWQQLISEAVHWLLYALVLTTTMTGWLLTSEHGWTISLFFAVPLPMLTSQGSHLASSIGKWHGTMEWAFGRRPCGGRDGAHVHLSRPDHAADAADEPHDPAYQQRKPEGLAMTPPGSWVS
jgi:cytochrome b561